MQVSLEAHGGENGAGVVMTTKLLSVCRRLTLAIGQILNPCSGRRGKQAVPADTKSTQNIDR